MKLFRFLRIILKGRLKLLESIYHKIWVRKYCSTVEEIIRDQDKGMHQFEKKLLDEYMKKANKNIVN